jgi:hypothetical protein
MALGIAKSESANLLAVEEAKWMLHVKTEHPDLKSDAMRRNWIIHNAEGFADLMLNADTAETLYKDKIATIRLVQADADILRSMMRSARDRIEEWNQNRHADQERERRGA